MHQLFGIQTVTIANAERITPWITNDWRHCSSPLKMSEELGLKTLQERHIAKFKMLHSFYYGYKIVPPSLLPSKA